MTVAEASETQSKPPTRIATETKAIPAAFIHIRIPITKEA
jgi:hypothetical protein